MMRGEVGPMQVGVEWEAPLAEQLPGTSIHLPPPSRTALPVSPRSNR